jgi:hypothetical protein
MNIHAGALTFAMKFDLAGSGTQPVRIRVLKMPGRRRPSDAPRLAGQYVVDLPLAAADITALARQSGVCLRPSRRMEPDDGPGYAGTAARPPRPPSQIWGRSRRSAGRGAWRPSGPGRRVHDKSADLDLKGHRCRSCFAPPRSVR